MWQVRTFLLATQHVAVRKAWWGFDKKFKVQPGKRLGSRSMGGFIQHVETLPSAVASPSSGFPIPEEGGGGREGVQLLLIR